jgi:RNA polymerase-binding transcription factor DksA
MAVKKATSAAKKGVQPGKAAPARAGHAKAPAKKPTAVTKGAGTKPVTRKTAKAPAKAAPAKTVANPGAKAAAKAPAKAAAKAPAKTSAKASAKAPAQKVAKAPAKGPAQKVAKAPAKSPAKAKAKAPARATARTQANAVPATPVKASAQPQRLRVTQNEKPWTAKEFAGIRAELEADIARLANEISSAEVDLAGLMRDVGDGAGDDPADAGTATFEREQEMSLANNAREVYEQSTRALARLAQGAYGICESCGNPIGKNRLLAFPRATLCMTCKSKQERR